MLDGQPDNYWRFIIYIFNIFVVLTQYQHFFFFFFKSRLSSIGVNCVTPNLEQHEDELIIFR